MDPPTRPPARVSVLRSLSQRTRKPDIRITSYDSSPAQEGQYTGGDTLTPVRSYVAGAEGYPSQNESKEKWIAQEEQEIAVRMSLDRQRSTHSSLHQSDSTVVPTGFETRDPAFEIDFTPEHDPRNPRCWPLWYKVFVIFTKSYSTTAVVLYSTAYTSSLDGIISYFGVTRIVATMGLTVFLLGMAVGSVVVAPLSEMYGRRPIYLISIVIFVVLLLPTALAHNYASILVPRLLSGIAASALVTNSPGTVNDLVNDKYRALAFSIWAIGPMNGPVVGPIIGGFVYQYLGWRWISWLVLIFTGIAVILIFFSKETYAPAILRKVAAQKRKETGDPRWWCRYDEKIQFWPLLKLNLGRPFAMMLTEPICIFWNAYIGIVYGILYLCFVAYPIVFRQERGWSAGIAGLAFLGIGLGNLLCIFGEPVLRKLIKRHRVDPDTGKVRPEAMVSVVCIGAVLLAAGELMFAWTCTPNVHWIWPLIAGIPFGCGNGCVFIYSNNYLVDSYGVYAASALAGNAVIRSVVGACLPLAGTKLYQTLGSNWAGTLLGLIEVACIPIPVVFYLYGGRIRERSGMIRKLQEDKLRMQVKQVIPAAGNTGPEKA
ncbi:hypothetical protein QFC20_006509 [Naganishia adeliensis]|uniref:Uncharacterized protein n=1 Tax=Naganishia adeliensis TaxID=92952 RepID=A0ACC2VAW5_9TREE|nr:hypothetical protein QFC20_006509 [Naganishia adeliensis]